MCIICCERPRDALLLDCGHMYTCHDCFDQMDERQCPMCRCKVRRVIRVAVGAGPTQKSSMPITPNSLNKASPSTVTPPSPHRSIAHSFGRKSIMQRVDTANFASSTKIEALVDALKQQPPNTKAIVFSQYTRFLELIQFRLNQENISNVKFLGSLNVRERRSVLAAFKNGEAVQVILMSLKAGGEGLNLQVCVCLCVCLRVRMCLPQCC